MLGFIGGSGLYRLESLQTADSEMPETPFGLPSDAIRVGEVAGQRIAFLSRHGSGHRMSPSEIPYAANICALKMLGVQKVVSISAVGSLREDYPPRSFVVPDQTIDRTVSRRRTFFDDGIVAHVSLADPFCPDLSSAVTRAAEAGPLPVYRGGTYVCIEGPQFSTRAESALYRSWGASVIGMTALPEARLAREAELCYACLAMVTDYDVWHADEGPVNVEGVLANLQAMTDSVATIVSALAGDTNNRCDAACGDALAGAIVTSPDAIGSQALERVRPIAGRYLAPGE